MKTIVFFLIVVLVISCEKEPLEVLIHDIDTVFVDKVDTLLLTDTLVNTDSILLIDTIVENTIELIRDTIYVDGLPVIIYDTVYIENVVYDTIYVNEVQNIFGIFHCYNWEQWKNGELISESGDKGYYYKITLDKFEQDLDGDNVFEYSYDITELTDNYFITEVGTYYISFKDEDLILTKYRNDYIHKWYLR
jgi:hypothetical protein